MLVTNPWGMSKYGSLHEWIRTNFAREIRIIAVVVETIQ